MWHEVYNCDMKPTNDGNFWHFNFDWKFCSFVYKSKSLEKKKVLMDLSCLVAKLPAYGLKIDAATLAYSL